MRIIAKCECGFVIEDVVTDWRKAKAICEEHMANCNKMVLEYSINPYGSLRPARMTWEEA